MTDPTDHDSIVKYWNAVEEEYPKYGGVVLARYFARFPEGWDLFPIFENVPKTDLANNPAIISLGRLKMKAMHEIMKFKGNPAALAIPLAKVHGGQIPKIPHSAFKNITEVIAEVVAEKSGLDNAAQVALMKAMVVLFNDHVKVTWKELGLFT